MDRRAQFESPVSGVEESGGPPRYQQQQSRSVGVAVGRRVPPGVCLVSMQLRSLTDGGCRRPPLVADTGGRCRMPTSLSSERRRAEQRRAAPSRAGRTRPPPLERVLAIFDSGPARSGWPAFGARCVPAVAAAPAVDYRNWPRWPAPCCCRRRRRPATAYATRRWHRSRSGKAEVPPRWSLLIQWRVCGSERERWPACRAASTATPSGAS